eukprot:g3503.t1
MTTHDLTGLGIAPGEKLRVVTADRSKTEDRKRGVNDPTFAVGRGLLTLKEVPDAAWLPAKQRVVCRACTPEAGWFDYTKITFMLVGGSKKVTVECDDPSQVERIFDKEATVTFLEPDDGRRSKTERSHTFEVLRFGGRGTKTSTSAGSLWLDSPAKFLKNEKGGKPKVSLGCTIKRQDEPRMELVSTPQTTKGFQELAKKGDLGCLDVSDLTFLHLNSSHKLLQRDQAKIDACTELRQLRNKFYGHVAAARLNDVAQMLPAIQEAMREHVSILLDNQPGVLADLNKAIHDIDRLAISGADIKGLVQETVEKVKKQAAAEKAVLEAEVAAQKAKKEKYKQFFNVMNARPADASDSYSDGAVERTTEELANAAKICREMFGEEFQLSSLTGNLKRLRVAGDMAKEELISSKAAYMLKRLKEEWKAKYEGKSFSQSSSTGGPAGGTTLTREEQAEIVRRAEKKFRAWVGKRCGGACQAGGGAQQQPPPATSALPIDPTLRGGFGTVFLAEDEGLTAKGRQPCVVKCPLSRDDKSWRKAGLRECRILNMLPSHPNIVDLIYIEDKDGVPLVTMEHCELGSIKTINSPLPMGLVVESDGAAAGGDAVEGEESKADRNEDFDVPAALRLTVGTRVALGMVRIKHRLHARHVFESRAAGAQEGLRGAALLDVMIQVMHGLNHLRTHGVVHQDIKPDNIVITGGQKRKNSNGSWAWFYEAKIIDFGLAGKSTWDEGAAAVAEAAASDYDDAANTSGRSADDVTHHGGSRLFRSPEQRKGGSRLDHASDIFSWAATYLDMLFGKGSGLDTDTPWGLGKRTAVPEEYFEQVAEDMPGNALQQLLGRCLQTDSGDRPDARACLQELRTPVWEEWSPSCEGYFRPEDVDASGSPRYRMGAGEMLAREARWAAAIDSDAEKCLEKYQAAVEAGLSGAGAVIYFLYYGTELENVRKDYDGAEAMYKRAIEADPNYASALGNYGHLLYTVRKDYDGAEAMYKQAIETDPNNAAALGTYGHLLENVRKDYDSAEAMYKRAIKADPNHASALYNYGHLLENVRKDYDGAEAMHKRAIEADPNHAAALCNYACLLENVRKDYDGAEAMHKRAIEADPNHAGARNNYGRLLEKVRKDYDGAEAMYKRAIEADPNNAGALYNYACLLENVRKDYDGAEAMYKQAIEADPNDVSVFNNYACLLENVRKDYDGAEAMYKRVIEADPNNYAALSNYACLLENVRKDYDGAEAMYKRAIEADPNDVSAFNNYACLLENVRKDYDGAEAMYKRAIEADPTHAGALSNYGLLLENVRKDYDGAEAMYKRAIEADPTNATVLSNYGLLLHLVRKDYDGAEAMYKRAIEANPPAEELVMLEQLSNKDKFDKATELKGKGNAEFNAGNMAAAAGLYEEAASYLEQLDDDPKGCEDADDESKLDVDIKALQISIFNNGCMAKIKQSDFKAAIQDATKALEIDPENNKTLRKALAAVKKAQDVAKAKEKEAFGGLFSQP